MSQEDDLGLALVPGGVQEADSGPPSEVENENDEKDDHQQSNQPVPGSGHREHALLLLIESRVGRVRSPWTGLQTH